jgi:hypothetical protein
MKIALEALKAAGDDISKEAIAKAINEIRVDTIRGTVKYNQHVGIVPAFIHKLKWEGDELKVTLLKTYPTDEVERRIGPRLTELTK